MELDIGDNEVERVRIEKRRKGDKDLFGTVQTESLQRIHAALPDPEI